MDRRLYQKIIVGLLVAVSGQQALYAQTPEQWRDSLTVLSKAIVQHPQSIDLRLKKAAVNIELSQWDYAVEEYGRVLLQDPRNLTALYFRAYANGQLRRYELAKTDYEAILKQVPKNFEAMLGLAMTHRKMNKTVEALTEKFGVGCVPIQLPIVEKGEYIGYVDLTTMTDILNYCDRQGMNFWEYVKEREQPDVWDYLLEVWHTTLGAVDLVVQPVELA